MERIGIRLDKTKHDPLVKNRKWMEYGAIRPMSYDLRFISIKSIEL